MAIFNNNLLAGAGAQSGTTTYEIDQSIRFRDADEHFMYSPTPSSGKDFTTTATISLWFKLGNLGAAYLAGAFYGNNNRYNILAINSDGQLLEYDRVGGASTSNGTGTIGWTTTRVFRDPSAWYHAVFVWDTTNAVQSERFRLYINGVRETDFATEQALGASELVYWFGKSTPTTLGAYFTGTGYADTYYFDGYMAEMHGVDGTALDQDSFGEFNSSGIWVPKEYTGSHGTDGFYIKGADASDLGINSAANGNDFTLNGISSHDQVTDSPTNNFAVLNPLDVYSTSPSNGNLKYAGSNGKARATVGIPKSGKWYWEVRADASRLYAGLISLTNVFSTSLVITSNAGSGYYTLERQSTTNSFYNASTSSTSLGSQTLSSGDVMAFAYDSDTRKLWIGYDGGSGSVAWYSSGDPASGSNELATLADDEYSVFVFDNSSLYSTSLNFGQEGTFGGTETAGGNSDSSGIGNFFYSVPSGFKALCTKNIGS